MADPKRVVERHVEAFNARDADAEPWSDDADFVAPNASMHGREQVLGFLGVFWDAFPDGRLETSRLLAEGSVVAAEGRFIVTHTGVLRTPAGDVAATGRSVDFRWMSSYEVRGDELASEHLYFDQAELLGQLGLDAGDLSALLPCARSGGARLFGDHCCFEAKARAPGQQTTLSSWTNSGSRVYSRSPTASRASARVAYICHRATSPSRHSETCHTCSSRAAALPSPWA